MKFSLLIAHYNNEIFFKDCFNSIINQTYQDFEVIIVDDFSNLNSYESVKELIKSDNRFKIYRNEKNHGVGFTKNRLIELASGEICGFLDPDDALSSNAIEEVVTIFKTKNCVAVYSKMMLCDKSLNQLYSFKRTQKVLNNDKLFVNISTNVAHFFTFKRAIMNSFNPFINSDLKSAVDQDLYLKIYEKGSFYFLNQNLYFYRLHDNGVSQSKNKMNAKNDFKNLIKTVLLRRNVHYLGTNKVDDLDPDDIYNFLVKREKSLSQRFKRILCKFL